MLCLSVEVGVMFIVYFCLPAVCYVVCVARGWLFDLCCLSCVVVKRL